eukprot:TRINITY_DN2644_c0_g1_i6.p1 TRINITY_DN2644_c0_g1~~TRINITY_DN2644_c0_g1_i6.p1  ORF type:complete len:138 (+),score=32.39 TRINITY_DN2644_c0_g1_i6:139-552(+)
MATLFPIQTLDPDPSVLNVRVCLDWDAPLDPIILSDEQMVCVGVEFSDPINQARVSLDLLYHIGTKALYYCQRIILPESPLSSRPRALFALSSQGPYLGTEVDRLRRYSLDDLARLHAHAVALSASSSASSSSSTSS